MRIRQMILALCSVGLLLAAAPLTAAAQNLSCKERQCDVETFANMSTGFYGSPFTTVNNFVFDHASGKDFRIETHAGTDHALNFDYAESTIIPPNPPYGYVSFTFDDHTGPEESGVEFRAIDGSGNTVDEIYVPHGTPLRTVTLSADGNGNIDKVKMFHVSGQHGAGQCGLDSVEPHIGEVRACN